MAQKILFGLYPPCMALYIYNYFMVSESGDGIMKVVVKPAGKPAIQKQQQPKVKRENRLMKFITILKQDINNFIHRKKDQNWEDYKRFCEIARGKR